MTREEIDKKNSELKKYFCNLPFELSYCINQTLWNYNKVELDFDIKYLENLYFLLPSELEAKTYAEEISEKLKNINFDGLIKKSASSSDDLDDDILEDENDSDGKVDFSKIVEKQYEIFTAVEQCKIWEYLSLFPKVDKNQDVLTVSSSIKVLSSNIKVLSSMPFPSLKDVLKNIKKIVFEGDTLEIDQWQFCGLKNLEEVVFTKELKYLRLGDYAFHDCPKLSKLTFEKEEKGQNIFWGEYVFSGTKLPDCNKGVYHVSNNIFYDKTHCYSVQNKESDCKRLVIPEGITWIGEEAFKNWRALEEVVLPESLKKLEYYSFEGCKNLKKINFPEGLEQICGGAFKDCISLEEIEFGSKLVDFGSNAFRSCENLLKADLSKITAEIKLRGNIFYGCKKLKSIYIPDNCATVYANVFKNSGIEHFEFSPNNQNFKVEKQNEGCVILYTNKELKKWAVYARGTVVLHDGIIPEDNILSHTDVQKVILPETMDRIPRWSFQNTLIDEIVIPDSVKHIEDYVLWDNPNLKRIVLGKELEEIICNREYQHGPGTLKGQTFNNCPNLKEIVVHPENKNFRFDNGILYAKNKNGEEEIIFSVDFNKS